MSIAVNAIVGGTVLRILDNNRGAIIKLPGNKEGFLHISEVSEKYTKDMNSSLKEGQSVTVKVISIDNTTGKIRVSIRKAQNNYQESASSSHRNKAFQKSSHPLKASPSAGSSFDTLLADYLKISNENATALSRSLDRKRKSRSKRRS